MPDGRNGAPAIELKGVEKRFGDFVAVADFNVQINKGEFFSLLGPSGCGKTTTLRMIAGLERVSGGEIYLEGNNVTYIPPYRRNVNTVFQDYAIFPHMTILKNVYFPLKMKRIRLGEAMPKIKKMLQLVNMEGYENRLPQQLSGGQRQRIALARSLVNEPAALLLDEPLGALDFKLRLAMQKVLKDIQRDVGITFVYVTHDQTEALTMSDRIAVMKDGCVHQIGAPDEIYKNPATAFVASFIGDMNFLYGKYNSDRDRVSVVEFSNKLLRAKRTSGDMKAGEEILICLRSENIMINPKETEVDNILPAVITRIVFRGSDYEVTCRFEDLEEIRTVIAATAWDRRIMLNEGVKIGWKAENIIIFPRSEEKDLLKYSSGEE
ncbi:MAG: ABC transporter ATP-binding protein [Spirochaetota bacterium]